MTVAVMEGTGRRGDFPHPQRQDRRMGGWYPWWSMRSNVLFSPMQRSLLSKKVGRKSGCQGCRLAWAGTSVRSYLSPGLPLCPPPLHVLPCHISLLCGTIPEETRTCHWCRRQGCPRSSVQAVALLRQECKTGVQHDSSTLKESVRAFEATHD